jgi:hypothetical protein
MPMVAPELQPLTRREGAATPRSPLIFRTVVDAAGTQVLYIEQTATVDSVANVTLKLPAEVGAFSI